MASAQLRTDRARPTEAPPRTGVLIGGSGLVGGTVLHYFKKGSGGNVHLLSPNSKELSLRVPRDIQSYFERVRPDFIINCAIATIDSDPLLTFEVNCMGAVYLAHAAQELGIPYIHLSSAALMPSGIDLGEEARPPPGPEMPNYARGKLLAELALEHMRETKGLDFTIIRLAVVYGTHDHKIQGFHRLLFSVASGSMPALLTTPGSRHSYTNARKLPDFIAHLLDHRDEFSGETYHFIDPDPVPLAELVLTIKRALGTKRPREIYVPYPLAKLGLALLSRIARLVSRIGVEARPPAERVFLRNFYESQVLSSEKLRRSSYVDPEPDATIFTELQSLLRYYLPRWQHLNLVESRGDHTDEAEDEAERLFRSPERLLASVLAEQERPFLTQCSLDTPRADGESDASGEPPGPAAGS
ncbi:MAG: NAD-dependent epimerase/dehydratase family protein [Myxococcota bacterium]|nr:NAD-dependent epimerase/dehydratase family protein [Myxococcota bacterium]